MIGKQISSYEVIEVLGSGTYGTVYRGQHIHDEDLEVAIKVVDPVIHKDPGFINALRTECRALDALDHPSVVRFRELVVNDDMVAMVMELLRGRDLEQMLQEGPQPIPEIIRIMQLLLAGLDHAHGHGVIHRDIKPANLFQCDDGRVKLMDFGIARAANGSQDTRTGTVKGTLDYIAPERFSNQTTPASDLYSLGLVCWELTTGQRACPDGDVPAKLGWHLGVGLSDPRTLRDDCPDWLADVLMTLGNKDPSQRYTCAKDALNIMNGVQTTAPPTSPPSTPPATQQLALSPTETSSGDPQGPLTPAPKTLILAKSDAGSPTTSPPIHDRPSHGKSTLSDIPIPLTNPKVVLGVAGAATVVGGVMVTAALTLGVLGWMWSSVSSTSTSVADGSARANASPYYTVGVQLLQSDHAMLGWQSLEHCHEEDPDNIDCRWEAGWGAWKLEDWKRVVDLWEPIVSVSSNHATIQTHLPQAWRKLQRASAGWDDLPAEQRVVRGVILNDDNEPLGCVDGQNIGCDLKMAPYAHPEVVMNEVQRLVDDEPWVYPPPSDDCSGLRSYAKQLGIIDVTETSHTCEGPNNTFCYGHVDVALSADATFRDYGGYEWAGSELMLPGATMEEGWRILQACGVHGPTDIDGFQWREETLRSFLQTFGREGRSSHCVDEVSPNKILLDCSDACYDEAFIENTGGTVVLRSAHGC